MRFTLANESRKETGYREESPSPRPGGHRKQRELVKYLSHSSQEPNCTV